LGRSPTDGVHQLRCGGDIADGVIAFESERWRINSNHIHTKANILPIKLLNMK
jgi:hypothetical protein